MDGIDVDAALDQRAQQAQVRQHRGQYRQAAAVARIRFQRRMRVGPGRQQRQRAFDPAQPRRRIQLPAQAGELGGGARFVRGGQRCDGRLAVEDIPGRRGVIGAGVHFHHRQAMQGDGRCRRLQGEVGQRQQQRVGNAGEQPAVAGQQARPAQQQAAGQQQEHGQRAQQQAAPGGGVLRLAGSEARLRAATAALQRVPVRPAPPQRYQQCSSQPGQRQRMSQRRGFAQPQQRPGQQCPGQQEAAAPKQRQPAGIGGQRPPAAAATQQRDGQRRRHLCQPGQREGGTIDDEPRADGR